MSNKMERMFSYEYLHGYTAALQDVLFTIKDIQFDMKLHKRKQNCKSYEAILDCMIKNRAILREDPDAFVRCNDAVDGGYEVYLSGKGVYNPDKMCCVEDTHEE